jgi:hypothetical protein
LKEFGNQRKVSIWKRYNQFKTLHKSLTDFYTDSKLAPFPKGEPWKRFNKDVITYRFASFQQMLNQIAANDLLRRSHIFREFLGVR